MRQISLDVLSECLGWRSDQSWHAACSLEPRSAGWRWAGWLAGGLLRSGSSFTWTNSISFRQSRLVLYLVHGLVSLIHWVFNFLLLFSWWRDVWKWALKLNHGPTVHQSQLKIQIASVFTAFVVSFDTCCLEPRWRWNQNTPAGTRFTRWKTRKDEWSWVELVKSIKLRPFVWSWWVMDGMIPSQSKIFFQQNNVDILSYESDCGCVKVKCWMYSDWTGERTVCPSCRWHK